MANRPIAEWKSEASSLRLSAWKNDKGLSFSFKKSYKDKDSGEWKESKYLYEKDLFAAQEIIQKALEYLAQQSQEAQNFQSKPSTVFEDDDIPF